MIKRILVRNLKPGMFTVDSGLLENEHPELYNGEGLILDLDEIQEIYANGYREVFVDANQGTYFFEHPDERDKILRLYKMLKQKVELRAAFEAKQVTYEEAKAAEDVYTASFDTVMTLYEDFSKGSSVDTKSSKVYVNDVIDSVTNNAHAFISLVKLRQYDDYSYSHSLNVAALAVSFGKYLNFDEEYLQILGMAGLYHDIGKVRVPHTVLNKPGRLTDKEFEIMKRHSEYGHDMLVKVNDIHSYVLRAAYEHHEHYGGKGYPRALSRSEINKTALVISLADVYDALTSERVYKKAMAQYKALCIMFDMRQTNFHPLLIEKFIKFLGIYPVGTLVRLRIGLRGVVIKQNPAFLLNPLLKILADNKGRLAHPYYLDLADQEYLEKPDYEIIDSMDPGTYKLELEDFFDKVEG